MSGYRKSWGQVMNRLIEIRGKEKNEDFFLIECKGDQVTFEYVLECEINTLPTAEFVDLLEQAEILYLPSPELAQKITSDGITELSKLKEKLAAQGIIVE